MEKNILRIFGICGIAGMMAITGSSYAAMTNKMLLDVLLENGAINQNQYDKLLQGSREEEKKSADDVKISLQEGALKLQTDDGEFKVQVGGRIQADSAWFGDEKGMLGNGTEIRRARLFIAGTVWNDWHYKGDYDFAGDATSIKDAYIRYSGLKNILGIPFNATVGNFKEPFGLEELTSSKYITFMERALPVDAFAPGRNLGFAINSYGKLLAGAWTAAAGVFGTDIDDPSGGNDEGYGLVGRFSLAPIAEKTRVIHIGGAIEHRQLKDKFDTGDRFQVRTLPEAHTADERLVSATLLTATADDTRFEGDVTLYGGEFAGVWGRLSVQSEYILADYDIDDGPSADFDGWYAYASWFVTGESRYYDAKKGAFGRVKPIGIVGKGGLGAWELASRFSYINLNDGDIKGGRENNWTFGLNWYATPTVRFMANYILADADGGENFDPDIFQLRAQVDF